MLLVASSLGVGADEHVARSGLETGHQSFHLVKSKRRVLKESGVSKVTIKQGFVKD